MDFVQRLDPSKLILAGTVLSFSLSLFSSPPYNLPIFLFGIYVQENREAVQSLQWLTGLLGISAIFDVVWMSTNEQNGFVKFFTFLLILLKIPTVFAFALSLRQRGSQFSGFGLGGPDVSGTTVWSMPGGFTSGGRDGYQTVGEETLSRNSRPAPPPARAPQATQSIPAAPGAYQTVV